MTRVRVLAVIDSLGAGGAEQSLAESIEPLRSRGVDVDVVPLVERAEGVDARVRAATKVHALDGDRSWQTVRSLRTLMQQTKPDLVYTTLFNADLAGRFASIGLGVPVLTSLVNTSYAVERLEDPRIRRSRFEAARFVDAVTARLFTHHFHALTGAVADSAEERLHIPRDRITVIPRGRSRTRLGQPGEERRRTARQALGIAELTPMVLSVGRQEYQKGQQFLLEAVASERFQQASPKPHLVMAGRSGAATGGLEQLVVDLDLADSVTMLGHVDNVPDLLAAADLFAFPSLFEGQGGALIEAMAMGVPVVTTDLAVTREVAGGAAEYVPPANPSALADTISALLGDDERRLALGREGMVRFESRFEFDAVMDEMAALFRAAAAGKRSTDEGDRGEQSRGSG